MSRPGASGASRARVRAARRRGRQRLALLVSAPVVAVVVAFNLPGAREPTRVAVSSARAHRRSLLAPQPLLRSSLVPSVVIPGRTVALPFPRTGEGAVAVGGLGIVASTRNERSVPVASVTKLMTAYIVLKDHPLHGRSGGPIFTMTAADHEAWIRASEADESNIEVKAGERLDERQLLQALMIPSADNIANYLAVWDAGSMRAFVAKMNAAAAAMHLRGTHFADPSGLSPGSRGSAVDMVRLATVALQNPELRQIVDEQFIRLPVMGKIWNNYDPAVGVDGIIGGKSGYTAAAQTNLVTAAWRRVGGHRVLVVCGVIDQPDSLVGDAGQDEALLNAVTPELTVTRLMPAKESIGEATATWSQAHSAVTTAKVVSAVGWPGLRLRTRLVRVARSPRLARGWPAGSVVGILDVEYPFATLLKDPAILQSSLGQPPPGWVPSTSSG